MSERAKTATTAPTRLLSLAAGVLPEFSADAIVAAAAAAGYRATGVWFDPKTWDAAMTRRIRALLRDEGLVALDIEPLWLGAGRTVSDDARRMIDAAAELGARNVLVVSANERFADTQHQFAQLCELVGPTGMRVAFEFLMITPVQSLAQALELVRGAQHPAAAVLIDTLHLARCGATAADVAAVPREWLPYAQLCDGPAAVAGTDRNAYLVDALDARSAAGEGDLPLADVLRALPHDAPLSLEVRSRRDRERYADPVERAAAVLERTQRFLAQVE